MIRNCIVVIFDYLATKFNTKTRYNIMATYSDAYGFFNSLNEYFSKYIWQADRIASCHFVGGASIQYTLSRDSFVKYNSDDSIADFNAMLIEALSQINSGRYNRIGQLEVWSDNGNNITFLIEMP